MQAQFEYDLLSYPPRAKGMADAAAAALAAAPTLGGEVEAGLAKRAAAEAPADIEDEAAYSGEEFDGEDEEEECGCGAEDDGVAVAAAPEAIASAAERGVEAGVDDQEAAPVAPADLEVDESSAEQLGPAKAKAKKKRTRPEGERLAALAKARPPAAEPERESFQFEKPPPKKPQSVRPALLVRLKPLNLEEAREKFFASNFTVAPKFEYAHSEEYVNKQFQENSNVCFEYLPEAKRIMQKVEDDYGGPERFMKMLFGEAKVSAEDMRSTVEKYLQDHGIEDKVEVRIVDGMLSAANVMKSGIDGAKYIVNIANGPISENLVPGICDHEVGTHLLRMMNDEHQAWHGRREKYGFANPWTTEEGFATINTYITMKSKLLYTQALRYWAVCRGAALGFAELFKELEVHMPEPQRRWGVCCRIKRGMIDTSLPGAFYMDQAYFKGAVEILQHLDEVDFGRLYGGQIALQDLDKVHFILRKDALRLPKFLNSAETLATYKKHCRKLIKENMIETATERVCKAVFIRTAKEFFKPKSQQAPTPIFRLTLGLGGDEGKKESHGNRSLDLSRLEGLARPREKVAVSDTEADVSRARRDLDQTRLLELSMPRRQTKDPSGAESGAETGNESFSRAPNLERLADLAKHRPLPLAGPTGAETGDAPSRGRVADLNGVRASRRMSRGNSAPPGQRSPKDDSAEGDEAAGAQGNDGAKGRRRDRSRRPPLPGAPQRLEEDVPPPPPAPYREPDMVRLSALAAPKPKKCKEQAGGEPCPCGPTKSRRRKRKKRSSHRILAMVQERREGDLLEEDAGADVSVDEGPEDSEGEASVADGADDIAMEEVLEDAVASASSARVPMSRSSSFQHASVADPLAASAPISREETSHPALVAVTLSASAPISSLRASQEASVLDASAASATGSASQLALPGDARHATIAGVAADTRHSVEGAEEAGAGRQQPALSETTRPLPRAVARARSLGAELRERQAASATTPAAGAPAAGAPAVVAPAPARARPPLPAGLPKGALAALGFGLPGAGASAPAPASLAARASAPAKASANKGDATVWKSVPIKTMQLDF